MPPTAPAAPVTRIGLSCRGFVVISVISKAIDVYMHYLGAGLFVTPLDTGDFVRRTITRVHAWRAADQKTQTY